MELLIQMAVTVLGGIVCTSLFLMALSILRTDKNNYEANRRLARSFKQVLRGEVKSYQESSSAGRDHRVCAGMAIDKKTKKLVSQGRLSDEAISSIH